MYAVTSITDSTNQTYIMPIEYQPIALHKEIIKSGIFEKIKKSIKRRNEKREVWIPLTAEMEAIYFEHNNMQFDGVLLEKLEKNNEEDVDDENLRQIQKKPNKTKLIDKFSVDKFSKNTTNVSQWLNTFETECERLEVNTDIEKIEMLRLLLEDACKDCYSSMIIKHTIDSDSAIWKKSLNETFADKGWSPIRYAMNFKYLQGSLLDYALKKERLLLEINKAIDKCTLIDIIATRYRTT